MDLIIPDWPAPANVRAVFTTRIGGCSTGVYQGLNLGMHVQDNPEFVETNRAKLTDKLELTHSPIWLNQVHGTSVYAAYAETNEIPTADAAVTTQQALPLTVMTADCLPVLFCDRTGTVVATAHAGWRGLCQGVIESTLESMQVPVDDILVWLGPAIGPQAFEVGEDVRSAFLAQNSEAEAAFLPTATDGKYFADIYGLAKLRLQAKGVHQIYGGQFCTFSDEQRFYSYRRSGQTGRMAGLIWLSNKS